MKLAVIVEGHGEDAAIRTLIHCICSTLELPYPDILPPFG